MSQAEVIAFLSDPRSYNSNDGSVARHETHGSIVFLNGERAYKLKRAVRFPYMDYSTVAQRRRMCQRELEINQRTAPSLYLEVRPILRGRAGLLSFGTEADSQSALDWVVVMRRFDQDALLEQMRVAGKLTRQLMRALGHTIVEFHSKAEVARNFGGSCGIRTVIDENVSVLKSRIAGPFDAELVNQYATEATSLLTRIGPLLDERRLQGHVRRCHGDLHLNNICMIDGRPVLFDAIEFSDDFACIDVLYDLAFLLMDLDRHGLRDHANTVLNHYLEETRDHSGLALLPLFLSCRAAVRAHTTLAASDLANEASARKLGHMRAAQLLERAVAYLANPYPRLIIVGGVSATGKSTLAYNLAPLFGAPLGAIVIRSDIIRKQLMGVPETVRLPECAYEPAVAARVYDRIAELAATTLSAGCSVIADAVFGKDSERRTLAEMGRRAGVPVCGLWLQAPPEILERRINARVGDVSDATADVLRAQLGFVSTPEDWAHVSAAGSPEQTANQARRVLSR